jgi:hypothetical protein
MVYIPQISTPRLLTTAIAAVAWSADRLDVFKLGTASDLQHSWWDGRSFHSCLNLSI